VNGTGNAEQLGGGLFEADGEAAVCRKEGKILRDM